jgi:hypothetical protein
LLSSSQDLLISATKEIDIVDNAKALSSLLVTLEKASAATFSLPFRNLKESND